MGVAGIRKYVAALCLTVYGSRKDGETTRDDGDTGSDKRFSPCFVARSNLGLSGISSFRIISSRNKSFS
jgi:hypothetical protein